jgi:lysophospholipase L1-like esterase
MRSRTVGTIAVFVVASGLVGAGAAAATRVPDPPARIRVLVVGESEAGTLAIGSPRGQGPHGLVARPELVLWDSTLLGCSILSAPVVILATGEPVRNQCGGVGRWQQQWTRDVAATKPDAVFLMAGARDLFDVAGPDGIVIHPGDAAWKVLYGADLRHLFGILRARGTPLVAIKPTCYGADTLPDAEPQASERLDAARVAAVAHAWVDAARASRVNLLDVDAITCPGGVADPVLRADGVHFTAAGADRLAPVITAALRRAVARSRSSRFRR